MRRLLLGLAIGAGIVGYVGIEWCRNTGSWSFAPNHRVTHEFNVETLEITIGSYYAELVWGEYR